METHFNCVNLVFGLGYHFQIVKCVVCFVSVNVVKRPEFIVPMHNLMSKSFPYKFVNSCSDLPVLFRKTHIAISICPVYLLL